MENGQLVEMRLQEIQAGEGNGAQVIVLGEVHGARHLPIFIGSHEMEALDRALHGKVAQRPMTHDLILNVIDGMGGDLDRVLIDKIQDDTFFGKLGVRLPSGGRALIDSRPSDAMVLAVRRNAPIYVSEQVLRAVDQRQGDEE